MYSASAFASQELPGPGRVAARRGVDRPPAAGPARRAGEDRPEVDRRRASTSTTCPRSKLSRSLDAVVEDCVNARRRRRQHRLGAAADAGSPASAAGLAENIVAHRDANGPFRTRTALKDVPRLGPKAFEQCAGFLRIRGGDDPLDVSSVHPEAYPVVRRIVATRGRRRRDADRQRAGAARRCKPQRVRRRHASACRPSPTSSRELEKPGRDPRPAFKTATFAEGVEKIADLRPGMVLEGVVTNVAAFGAFVDVGVHQDGLVHVSAMSQHVRQGPARGGEVRRRRQGQGAGGRRARASGSR